jgi:hypothetical protein
MARLSARAHPDFERREDESFEAYLTRTQGALDRLLALSDALPEGELEGALVKFPVADGYAWYDVVKVKPLTLRHINFCDGYHAPLPLIRGLRVADVFEQVSLERAWHAGVARHSMSAKR